MPKETLQERVLMVVKEGGESGIRLVELYPRFPAHLKQSIRGTVLSLVKKGSVQRIEERSL